MRRSLGPTLLLCLGMSLCLSRPAAAIDPRGAEHEFQYSLYAPGGFSAKKSKAIPRPDPKQPKAFAVVNADGKFADFAQWYYDLGSDPKAFETWWRGYFTDPQVWKESQTPVWQGTTAGNQGHRIIAWIGQLKKIVERDPEIDPAVKQKLMNDAWREGAEKAVRDTINDRGLMQVGPNTADMACHFHFIRSKFGAMGLRLDHIYTLDHAQDLVVSLLTEPWIINADDRFVAPPGADYLEAIGRQKLGKESDIRLVVDGKVRWTGGPFSGWKDKPSLHGTWDGLAIINSLFKYFPEPDPASPKSIFHKWNQLPAEKKKIGTSTIILCSRRLWLDWAENKGACWCWVRDGKATDDDGKPSDAPLLSAYDGYGDNQFAWAKSCWEEMFGNPNRNTNDGVQAFLAIAHGTIHSNLKTPVGQQVPGRYDYDPEVQKRKLEEDLKRLGTAATRPSTDDESPRLKSDPAGKPSPRE